MNTKMSDETFTLMETKQWLMQPQQTPTEMKEGAVQSCDIYSFPYDNAGFNNALLYRETTVWSENKQVLFSCFGSWNHFAD